MATPWATMPADDPRNVRTVRRLSARTLHRMPTDCLRTIHGCPTACQRTVLGMSTHIPGTPCTIRGLSTDCARTICCSRTVHIFHGPSMDCRRPVHIHHTDAPRTVHGLYHAIRGLSNETVHGLSADYPRVVPGLFKDAPRTASELPADFTRTAEGHPTDAPRTVRGLSSDYPRVVHELSADCGRANRLRTGCPRAPHRRLTDSSRTVFRLSTGRLPSIHGLCPPTTTPWIVHGLYSDRLTRL